jgi:hypothetical protein
VTVSVASLVDSVLSLMVNSVAATMMADEVSGWCGSCGCCCDDMCVCCWAAAVACVVTVALVVVVETSVAVEAAAMLKTFLQAQLQQLWWQLEEPLWRLLLFLSLWLF